VGQTKQIQITLINMKAAFRDFIFILSIGLPIFIKSFRPLLTESELVTDANRFAVCEDDLQ
jgi:hypothetical protein